MNSKTILSRYRQHIIVALLAIGVFCFWLFLYPFIPVMREASLLFLWNTDYMMERLAIPGGLAQYLGEGVTHLFLNPVNAAIIYAILFVAAQLLSKRLLRQFFPKLKSKYRFVLSLIPPIILWRVAMLPHIPLTPTMAVLLVMGAGCAVMSISSKRATKPFMLPQRDPKQFYRRLLYSYNTPDFTSRPIKNDARRMGRNIENDQRTPTNLR